MALFRRLRKLVPKFIKKRINVEKESIFKFIIWASKQSKKEALVLDAGAGKCPYKKFFAHTNYESTDFQDIFDKTAKEIHTFSCNLEDISKPTNTYDVVINTQVLEHVANPQKVVKEFYRVLKPNGKLFLTSPLAWGFHGKPPYNYFYFTKYGLEELFRNAGFKIKFIKPRGGFFWYLSEVIQYLPSHIYTQYLFKWENEKKVFSPGVLGFLLAPIYLLSIPFCNFLLPLLFYYLDKLDKKRYFTLGFACYCVK